MIFKDGRWQEWVSTKTQEEIAKKVDDAIQKAKDYTDELNDRQASEAAAFQSEANAALSSAAAERTVFSSNAASMATSAATHANSMANSAAAYGKAQAASALSSANSALTTAKSDLTTAIEQETEDRNKAVSVVNSQAQDYATQAESDAIEAAKTADGQVRKDFKETTDALSSTISQNKSDAEGKISTAQATATQALDGLKTKVSQTDYNTKTGKLQTDLTATSQTANQAKLDIVAIKSEADSQSAQINDIVSDAKGTKQTISDLKTEQGKQSGSIATLQSRADGFDATVTKVNNLSVGGRNLYLNSKVLKDNYGINNATVVTVEPFDSDTNMWHIVAEQGSGDGTGAYLFAYGDGKIPNNSEWSYSADIKGTGKVTRFGMETGEKKPIKGAIGSNWSRISQTGHVDEPDHKTMIMYFDTKNSPLDVYIKLPKLERGNVATDWTPAPEDVDSATAKAQLTADQATLDLSTYKTNANGRISKAQSDITATANEVKTKVSQSDFDTTTGDLTTKYGQVKATADAVTTDVSKYKDTNDKKVSANTANIATMSDQITSKVSKTDFDKATGDLNGKFTQQKQTVDSISQTVTELQAKANSQGQVNQLMNTEFNPDTEGWTLYADKGSNAPYPSYVAYGSRGIGFNTANADANTFARLSQTVILPSTRLSTDVMSLSWRVNTRRMDNYCHIWLVWQDANGVSLGQNTMGNWNDSTLNKYNVLKWENISIPIDAKQVDIRFETREGTNAYIFQPMLTFEKVVGDYVQGNYNNNNRVAALELDIDGIHGLVDDPKNGMKATWDLASNGQTLAVKAQQDATSAITTAKGLQTTINDNKNDLQAQITATAKQVATEMTDRANGDKSVRTDMANLIDQRVKNVKSGYESAISQSANAIMLGVSMPNKLFNTEFTPDLEGWEVSDTGKIYKSYMNNGSNLVAFDTRGSGANTSSYLKQSIPLGTPATGRKASLSWRSRWVQNDNYVNVHVYTLDNNNKQLTDVFKSFDQTHDGAWSDGKFENIEIPDDARYIKVSFLVREGAYGYLGKPMLVFDSTVGTYMPGSYSSMNTSTVLELFKDNWALGIADNSGKIISGINGDTSGTVIQGKKLVINSDTTINGKAFIDGSVIKNASIGTAQIGKAAIGSAQIINVDVSKISGNIANFITTNVNTLNAKVLYGDTGHLGTTDTGRVINKQDNHLQLASKGMYNSANDRAQLELLSHTNDIDANMQGSFNYYSDVRKGHGLGIRLVQNQILAIDEDGGSKMLYLSPYQCGEVRVVSRDKQAYYPMRASSFNTMSSRSAKSNIVPFEDCALDIVKNTKIRTYVKSGKQEIGVISDEADPRMLTDDDNAVSLYDYTSILYKAVQELTEKVEELQNERPNN